MRPYGVTSTYDFFTAARTMPITAADGADRHCEPLAPGLRGERILDWLDDRVPA